MQGANTEFGASAAVCSGLVCTGRTPITIPKVHDAGPVPCLHAVVRVRVSVIRVSVIRVRVIRVSVIRVRVRL